MERVRDPRHDRLAAPLLSEIDWQMRDYFTTLAASNLGFVRPLQPRVPSLYETPATGPAAVEPVFESNGARTIFEAPQGATNIGDQNRVEQDLPLPVETPASPRMPAATETRLPGEVRRSAHAEKGTPHVNESPHSTIQLSGFETIRVEPEQAADLRRQWFSQPTTILREPEAVAPRNRLEPAPLAADAGAPSQGLPRTQAETFEARREMPGAPIDLNQMPPFSKSSEPTIHVTIGRIEVMAATPPPVARKPNAAPAPPRLSLEEYLKGGREGRR